MANSIFISYRRADSEHIAGRIHDRLANEFGDTLVFMDVEDMPRGEDFRDVLQKEIVGCKVLLVVIGKQWVDITGADGERRLLKQNDFVRYEVETALNNPEIKVIPVLVDDARMPSASLLPESLSQLPYLHASPVRGGADFTGDMRKLIESIKPLIEISSSRNVNQSAGVSLSKVVQVTASEKTSPTLRTPPQRAPIRGLSRMRIMAIVTVLVLMGAFVYFQFQDDSAGSSTEPIDDQQDIMSPDDVITTYWNAVGDGDYNTAWNILSSSFQANSHDDSFTDYRAAYNSHNYCAVSASNSRIDSQTERTAVVSTVVTYTLSNCSSRSVYDMTIELTLNSRDNRWHLNRVLRAEQR